jgi:DNA-directed RNA polymerase I, II, and III subunit RPABC1
MDNAKIISKELISQRNYKILEENSDEILAQRSDGEKVYFFFVNVPKMNIDIIKAYIQRVETEHIKHVIIVYRKIITAVAKSTIQTLDKIKIQLFAARELQYNITKHRLVPFHEKVSKKEVTDLLKKFGTKLPKLLKSDPVVRFYGFERRDIIRIIRSDSSIVYRIIR